MCDCIWRSAVDDDKNVEAADSVDYFMSYRFIDQSSMNSHASLIALVIRIFHRSGRTGNPTRRSARGCAITQRNLEPSQMGA